MSETAKFANVVLPGASFSEKSGTFTNGERRVQRVNEVIPPLAGTKPDGSPWAWGDNRNGQLGDGWTSGPIGDTYYWGLPATAPAPAPTPEFSPLPDTDGDSFTDAEESLAGTDPRDAASALRLSVTRTAGSAITLAFPTVPGRTYAV